MIHGHQVLPWGDPGALGIVAREMDVDILLSGHTHQLAVWEEDGRYFINPGSATGRVWCVPRASELTITAHCIASHRILTMHSRTTGVQSWVPTTAPMPNVAPSTTMMTTPSALPTPLGTEGIPSFVLLDLNAGGGKVVLYIYKLIAGDVRVERMEYVKSRRL
jgi:vacuolar protein sorting-associated protein 29